jgi:hypothetical protein
VSAAETAAAAVTRAAAEVAAALKCEAAVIAAAAGCAAAAVAAAVAGVEMNAGSDIMITCLKDFHRSVAAIALASLLTVPSPGVAFAQEQADQAAADQAAADQDADDQADDDQIDLSSLAAVDEPPAFDDPAAVVEAFKAALAANDVTALAKLLGLDAEKLKADEATMSTVAELRELTAKHVVVQDLEDRKLLQLGPKLWPFPFPIVKGEDGKWAFDTYAGLEEIGNRRLGENELQAINTVREYIEAQQEYAASDRDGDGVLEYAQKLISTEGQTDGLYWPPEQGDGESPAGDFANEAALDKARQGEGYFGYRFKILTGQGDQIAGGDYDYVINDNMIGGFALLAWPVKYEDTGVMTFAVNQHGIVYQTDLGPATEDIVKYIDRFNPGDDWQVVND